MSPKKSGNADKGLAHEQFPDLNQEFYCADPMNYFQRRVQGLIMTLSDSPAIHEALIQGVSYGKTTIGRSADHKNDQEATDTFASTESTNLLHHATECMLRLYLAHVDHQICPWLEIARMRAPAEFKSRVATLSETLHEQDTIDSLVDLFLGNTDPQRLGLKLTSHEWQQKVTGLTIVVAYACNTVLSDAGLYNATKHGLAVVGGNHGFSLSTPQRDLTISTDGPALAFLDLADQEAPNTRRWAKNLTFVQAESNIVMTEVISRHIGSLWAIARFRYVGVEPEDLQLPLFEPSFLHEVITEGRGDEPIGFASVAETLMYYANDSVEDA